MLQAKPNTLELFVIPKKILFLFMLFSAFLRGETPLKIVLGVIKHSLFWCVSWRLICRLFHSLNEIVKTTQ